MTSAPLTSTSDRVLDDEQLNDVARLARLLVEIKDRTEQAEEIKLRLRQLGTGKWFHGSTPVLEVAPPGRQFDPGIAADVIPAHLLDQCSDRKIVAAKAKALLPAELYAHCCTDKAAAVKPL